MLKRFITLATLLTIGLSAHAQRLIVSDSGAVEREISRLVVIDSGGTAREIDRGFVVDSGGTARLFYSGVTVTLSGETVSHVVTDPSNALAGLRFDDDGNVYKTEGSGNDTQIDTGTDWIRPVDTATSYQFRYTNLVGDALTGVSPAEDSWQAISGGDFILQMAQAVAGSRSATFDVEVRLGTGATITSAEYSLTATVQP